MTDPSGARDSQNRSPAYRIRVKGLVQGVGFRPFVYRLAHIFGYKGWVENRSDGVLIMIPAEGADPEPFLSALRAEAPPAADIESVEYQFAEVPLPDRFEIRRSNEGLGEITEISPDIAVCRQCLEDMKKQPHRIGYPLVNCTHCGPRFSIIRGLPYDRELTTMEPFIMCPECTKEYADVGNRRFHAQPIACNACGPKYSLIIQGNESALSSVEAMIEVIAERIASGETVALKGTGGYHLLCDAHQEDAVLRLREAKERDGKPFAVMFRDIKVAHRYVHIDREEQDVITSWRKPVVLLRSKGTLPGLINGHLDTIGAILPYMPIHYLLFYQLKTDAVVFTSGNISDEPVEINDEKAVHSLGKVASAILRYNREIYNRADDSVVRVQGGQTMVIRRSRGYVPGPVRLKFDAEGIFAAGGELKGTFCIGRGKQA
ncbi:MAG: Sua5/YciO/YrdC/YwlC family protein, partial [Bacteroidales bacterium]